MNNWTPRYVAYARAHGRTADAQHNYDSSTDSFWRFSLWIHQQMQEAEEANHPCVFRWSHIGLQIADQNLWDEWLNRPDATMLKESSL